jgi:hypothetical protein
VAERTYVPPVFTNRSPLLPAKSGLRPLAFPAELWVALSDEQKSACFRGQELIGAFGWDRTMTLNQLSERAGLSLDEALEGLRLLDGMDLVSVESDPQGLAVTLVAVPEDHVRVHTADGSDRWLFVARPLEAPEVDPTRLN